MRLAGAAKRVATEINSVPDAFLAARVLTWACLLPAMKRLLPVASLASVMHLAPRTIARDPLLERRVVTFARWAARVTRWNGGGNCLERGLISYRYLGAAGANPTLVVGVGRADTGVIGHAWVLVDGRPVGDDEAAIRRYTPVLAFAPDGSLVDAARLDLLAERGPG
jgi:hypothetical protein